MYILTRNVSVYELNVLVTFSLLYYCILFASLLIRLFYQIFMVK